MDADMTNVAKPMLRRVKVFGWVYNEALKKNQMTYQGDATFHQFGIDFEELSTITVSYTTAIVEWPDGRVQSVAANLIQFID